MGKQQFANNLSVTISGAIDDTQTSITLATGQGSNLPAINTGNSEYLKMTMAVGYPTAETAWEVVHVTDVTGDVLTVARAQDGTTGLAWPADTVMEARNTESTLENFLQKDGDQLTGTLDANNQTIDNAVLNNAVLNNALDAQQNVIDNAEFTSFTETGASQVTVVANASDIDYNDGMVHLLLLDDNTTLSFSNEPVGKVITFTVFFLQDGTGGRTVTLPAEVTKGALDLATGAGQQTIATFISTDGGTNYTVLTSFKEA